MTVDGSPDEADERDGTVHDRRHERLSAERARALHTLANLTGDFDAVVEATREVATDDEHDPEGATIAFERAQVDALLNTTRAHLADIEQAIGRLRDGSYGVCLSCGCSIAIERLEVQPATTLCIACATPRHRPLGR